jgi:hypothetical protein
VSKLISSQRDYVRLPTRTLSVIALVLASTIIVAGLAVWTWSDFSDVKSDAETIVSTTSLAMDDLTRASLQSVDGVLESLVARIEERGIHRLGSEAEREYLSRVMRRLPENGGDLYCQQCGRGSGCGAIFAVLNQRQRPRVV